MRPIFVVAPPRSGSALLVETLRHAPDVLVAPGALDACIAARCGDRESLTATDATPEIAGALRDALATLAGDARLLDASPLHCQRVPFLHAVFPDATFVYVYREPRRALHDMERPAGESLEELARRWNATTSRLLDDLDALPPGAWMVTAYRPLTAEPQTAVAAVATFLGVRWDGRLPPAPTAETPPPPEIVSELEAVEGITREVAARARDVFARPPARPAPTRARALEIARAEDAVPFRSVSTPSFPDLLWRLGISLVVSTYQSSRLILVRAANATTLNTHFRTFRSPMGVAIANGRLAVGTECQVWEYRNQPAVAPKVEPAGTHDACYVPRKIHVTGDIRVHEIAFAADALWIVNTRFSALCTLDDASSFVPRWRPPFVTHLAAEDRCHLNGMAVVDGRVRYVTALGATNSAGGWREGKATGGLLLDVDSGERVLSGLSMPHSPRRHDDRFFILESGRGSLATADLATGRVETIAELPGFTRGLAFAGPFAFVGLSQVRETNVFGGLPLTERATERQCGVYVVDLRRGQVVAFLRFEGDVREIFDIQVLHGTRYPELLELSSPLVSSSFTIPDAALPDLAAGVRL
jgi:uncharacterized protein (TIGR03032 family)